MSKVAQEIRQQWRMKESHEINLIVKKNNSDAGDSCILLIMGIDL